MSKLDRAHQIMIELKQAGMSEKELNEVSLLILLELGLRHNNVEDITDVQTNQSKSDL